MICAWRVSGDRRCYANRDSRTSIDALGWIQPVEYSNKYHLYCYHYAEDLAKVRATFVIPRHLGINKMNVLSRRGRLTFVDVRQETEAALLKLLCIGLRCARQHLSSYTSAALADVPDRDRACLT